MSATVDNSNVSEVSKPKDEAKSRIPQLKKKASVSKPDGSPDVKKDSLRDSIKERFRRLSRKKEIGSSDTSPSADDTVKNQTADVSIESNDVPKAEDEKVDTLETKEPEKVEEPPKVDVVEDKEQESRAAHVLLLEEQNRQQTQFINDLQDKTLQLEKELLKLLKTQEKRSQEVLNKEDKDKKKAVAEIEELKNRVNTLNELNSKLIAENEKLLSKPHLQEIPIQTEAVPAQDKVPEQAKPLLELLESSTQTESFQESAKVEPKVVSESNEKEMISTLKPLPLFSPDGLMESLTFGLQIESSKQEISIPKSKGD